MSRQHLRHVALALCQLEEPPFSAFVLKPGAPFPRPPPHPGLHGRLLRPDALRACQRAAPGQGGAWLARPARPARKRGVQGREPLLLRTGRAAIAIAAIAIAASAGGVLLCGAVAHSNAASACCALYSVPTLAPAAAAAAAPCAGGGPAGGGALVDRKSSLIVSLRCCRCFAPCRWVTSWWWGSSRTARSCAARGRRC